MESAKILDKLLVYSKLNAKAFSEKIGLGRAQAIYDIQSGKTKSFSHSMEIKILSVFPDINKTWLLTGEGDMLKDESSLDTIALNPDCKFVPLLPISAQGGSLNDFVISVKGSDLEQIVSPVMNVDFAMPVSGDSMAPEYPAGSYIYIKKINEHAFIEWGKVYVLDTCNGSLIKEIHEGDEETHVICYSINPDPKYKPFKVQFDDIYGMYKVVMCMATK